jgi:hypothetical protein
MWYRVSLKRNYRTCSGYDAQAVAERDAEGWLLIP